MWIIWSVYLVCRLWFCSRIWWGLRLLCNKYRRRFWYWNGSPEYNFAFNICFNYKHSFEKQLGYIKSQIKSISIINPEGVIMKKIFRVFILFCLVSTLVTFNFVVTNAAPLDPCKYVLDLENELCCEVGGNCCGPDCN